jgi:hypothetical protein
LQHLLARGLDSTASLWPPLKLTYAWVHQAAHILANHDQLTGEQVRAQYQDLLACMDAHKMEVASLSKAIEHFRKITESFAPGLFYCYDVPGLPPTNNALEQCFGSARYHERRATGRRGAIPGVVVRGPARMLATLATRLYPFGPAELCPSDYQTWRDLRRQLSYREENRRKQWRFRKDPATYLADIEERLLQ